MPSTSVFMCNAYFTSEICGMIYSLLGCMWYERSRHASTWCIGYVYTIPLSVQDSAKVQTRPFAHYGQLHPQVLAEGRLYPSEPQRAVLSFPQLEVTLITCHRPFDFPHIPVLGVSAWKPRACSSSELEGHAVQKCLLLASGSP